MMTSKFLRNLARNLLYLMPDPLAERLRVARRATLNIRSREAVFSKIARNNGWDGTESVSGPGSTMQATAQLRASLPSLLVKYGIGSILDIPCGDAHWITKTLPKGIDYIGADIVPALIKLNRAEKPHLGRFEVLDLVSDRLPRVDMVIVRDCFIHLPNSTVNAALKNIKASGSSWLLATQFVDDSTNIDIEVGGYRPINLLKPPFFLSEPLEVLSDFDGLNHNGKHIALWRIEDI